MKDFRDRVAVVTGAASGIGRGLAERFAAEGMKVVLADVEEDALRQAEAEFREKGVDVLGVRTDVSKPEELEKLAQQTRAQPTPPCLTRNSNVFDFPLRPNCSGNDKPLNSVFCMLGFLLNDECDASGARDVK